MSTSTAVNVLLISETESDASTRLTLADRSTIDQAAVRPRW